MASNVFTKPKDQDYYLQGLKERSSLIHCPLGSFKVNVEHCRGHGACADVCAVNVFTKNTRGKCVVANEDLCFGCMACVAQCSENGILVEPTE
jgi:NAD-dependent dihydropyrimidine dehydrogenase PreA subunit